MISPNTFTLSDAERGRLTDAQGLAQKGSGGVEMLLEMLKDPSWVVRRAVVDALALAGDAAVLPLCELLRTKRDNEARIAAAVDALVASRGNPESAVLALASNPETAVVADAIQILGRRKSVDSVPALIRFTKHENDIVSVAALEALGRIGGRSAVEALIETVSEGSFFRIFPAIDILGRSGDRRVIEPLVKLLTNPNFLPEAARALGRTGERSALHPLAELLKSNADSVVRVAAVALWDLRVKFKEKSGGDAILIDELLRNEIGPEQVRRLTRLTLSLDVSEAIAVCRLFGAVRSEEAAPLLTSMLDGPSAVAECAAQALKRIGKENDSHLLRAIREGSSERRKILLPVVTRSAASGEVTRCLEDSDPEVRALACETLARLGNPNVAAKLFPLLSDSNLRVVHAATAAIQALGSRESRDLAVQHAKSESAVIRRSALRILSYFGDEASLGPLLAGLVDPDSRVREVAIQGLPYVEDSRAQAALYEATRSSDDRSRALAMRALGQMPKAEERAFSILLKGLRDSDAWVRYYACQALGRLAFEPAADEIAGLIADTAGQVRVSAVEALSHLNSPRAHAALKSAAASSEADVKRAAIVGLGMRHSSEDLAVVMAAAASADIPTRLIALSALVNFHSPQVVRALSTATVDADEQIRAAAVGFLASRSEEEATEVLVELLSSANLQDQARAALQMPNVGRVPGLIAALETANDDLAGTLVSILMRIPHPNAKRALFEAMKLKNVAARKAAVSGIAASREPDRVAALRDAAQNDPDKGVRQICSLLISE